MKLILLAAAAAIAVPALAQQTTPPMSPAPDQSTAAPATPPADQSTMAPTTPGTPPAADPNGTMTNAPAANAPMTTGSSDPVGGYQPSTPPGAPAAPGSTVTFQQPQSPAAAYPPPAAMDKYPPCKKGQYDNCREASTASGAGMHHRRRK